MARYKHIELHPRFVRLDQACQFLPGLSRHALIHLRDHEGELPSFDARLRNDDTGASACAPALWLKVFLCGDARGIVSSRAIEGSYREPVTFIALCGDNAPQFTTIAHFINERPHSALGNRTPSSVGRQQWQNRIA